MRSNRVWVCGAGRAAHPAMAGRGGIVMGRYAGSVGRMSILPQLPQLSILSKPESHAGCTVRARPLIEERVT